MESWIWYKGDYRMNDEGKESPFIQRGTKGDLGEETNQKPHVQFVARNIINVLERRTMNSKDKIRIEKYLLIPVRKFLSYRYVRETKSHEDNIYRAKKKLGYMQELCGYHAQKIKHGWYVTKWWLKEYDEAFKPDGPYRVGAPCEGVDPKNVVLDYFPYLLDLPFLYDTGQGNAEEVKKFVNDHKEMRYETV